MAELSPNLARLLDLIDNPVWSPTFRYVEAVNRGEIDEGEPIAIDCGNSGTTIRLMAGWLAGQGGVYRLIEENFTRQEVVEMVEELERFLRPSRRPEALAARRSANEALAVER